MRRKFVEVHMLDAVSETKWLDSSDLPKPQKVIARGWVVSDTPEALIICHSLIEWDDGTDYGGVFVIPRGMVTKVKALRV